MYPRGLLVRSLMGLPLVPEPDEVDNLGLPLRRPETQEAREDCRRKAVEAAKDAFAAMRFLLGEEEARAIFREASRPNKGRPVNTRQYEMNALLLWAYDEFFAMLPECKRKSAPRIAAEYVKNERNYPGTAVAAERQLRRLLKERRKNKAPRSLVEMLKG